MTIDQYEKWANEIRQQPDLIIATQQFQRLCNVFIQDVWMDAMDTSKMCLLKSKSQVMFDLHGHFVK